MLLGTTHVQGTYFSFTFVPFFSAFDFSSLNNLVIQKSSELKKTVHFEKNDQENHENVWTQKMPVIL